MPGRGEVAEEAGGQAGIVFGPALLAEVFIPALAPEFGVSDGQTVEGEKSDMQRNTSVMIQFGERDLPCQFASDITLSSCLNEEVSCD